MQRTWKRLTESRKALDPRIANDLASEREIREKLTQPVSVSFNQRPLQQAIDTLVNMVGIPILIDQEGLRNEGILLSNPVTLDLKGKEISLKSTLDVMLESLHLTYVSRTT